VAVALSRPDLRQHQQRQQQPKKNKKERGVIDDVVAKNRCSQLPEPVSTVMNRPAAAAAAAAAEAASAATVRACS
jgi:predicted lipid-binding transport protein (Tim44 family)